MVDIVTSNLVNQFELIISVTGDLVIPMVGKININQKSLKDAINLIESSFKAQYSDAQLSVILKDAGNYNLYIKNPYGLNDEYKVNSFMRISDLSEIISAFGYQAPVAVPVMNRFVGIGGKSGVAFAARQRHPAGLEFEHDMAALGRFRKRRVDGRSERV